MHDFSASWSPTFRSFDSSNFEESDDADDEFSSTYFDSPMTLSPTDFPMVPFWDSVLEPMNNSPPLYLEEEGIAVMIIENGEWNILTMATVLELLNNFIQCEENEHCRGVIITSNRFNRKSFTIGFDIKEFTEYQSEAALRKYVATIFDLFMRIYKSRLATVAMIDGIASGGGAVLAACCDRRVMTTSSVLGFNESKMGLTMPVWIMERLTQLIGFHNTEHTLMSSAFYSADQCLKNGLADQVVTSECILLDAALIEMRCLIEHDDPTNQSIKQSMREPIIMKYDENRDQVLDTLVADIMSPQVQGALKQFKTSMDSE